MWQITFHLKLINIRTSIIWEKKKVLFFWLQIYNDPKIKLVWQEHETLYQRNWKYFFLNLPRDKCGLIDDFAWSLNNYFFQKLMISQESPIIEFYPTDFKTDLNGKQQDWEAVVLIPFIEEVSWSSDYNKLVFTSKCIFDSFGWPHPSCIGQGQVQGTQPQTVKLTVALARTASNVLEIFNDFSSGIFLFTCYGPMFPQKKNCRFIFPSKLHIKQI